MISQPDKSYFMLVMLDKVEAHEIRNFWTLTKNSEVDN